MVTMNTIAMVQTPSCLQSAGRMPVSAIDVVVTVFRQPTTFSAAKQGMLPTGMLDVIKAAAGDDDTLKAFSEQKNLSQDHIKQASQFYLQKLLTTAGADNHRKLGLDYGATSLQVKDHKRWLLKWLHPDRNPSKWESLLFVEVGKAAAQIEVMRPNLAAPQVVERRQSQGRRKSWGHAERRRPIFSFASFLKSAIVPFAILVVLTGALIAALGRYAADGSAQAQMFGYLKW
jgi:hypothetical protein